MIEKLNSIKKLAVTALVTLLVGIFCFVLFPFLVVSGSIIFAMLTLYLPIILFIVAGICELVAAIKILATHWENPEVESSKALWGILAILLLPTIAPLIFVSKAKSAISRSGGSTTTTTTTASASTTTPTADKPAESKSASEW